MTEKNKLYYVRKCRFMKERGLVSKYMIPMKEHKQKIVQELKKQNIF